LTALVAHSSHNHACDPLEELVDRPKCHAEADTQHRCKYEGDANGHRSCADIKTAWEESDPPENSNYFVEIGGANGIAEKTQEVFCTGMDSAAETADTFAHCEQCTVIDGSGYVCADTTCCGGMGMTQVTYADLPTIAQQHYKDINTAGHSNYCTADIASISVEPSNFIGMMLRVMRVIVVA
jgi:hypothetical protein